LTRIWITRAQPGAEATAERVTALGLEALVAPVLAVRDLPARIDLAGVGALAFTSANAVRAFATRCEARALPVFAVGAATATAAAAAGFGEVVSAEGDVSDLARLIKDRAENLTGTVLHPGATEPAGNLPGALSNAGVEARALALYETAPVEAPKLVLDGIATITGVLVHSPKAALRLAVILADQSVAHMTAYALSPEVCAPLAGLAWGQVIAAPLPTEDALLSLLIRTTPRKAT
jgi:uroporphyrinogen-III synthase